MLKMNHTLPCSKEIACFEYPLFVEYAILCELADGMMFWLPWLNELE